MGCIDEVRHFRVDLVIGILRGCGSGLSAMAKQDGQMRAGGTREMMATHPTVGTAAAVPSSQSGKPQPRRDTTASGDAAGTAGVASEALILKQSQVLADLDGS